VEKLPTGGRHSFGALSTDAGHDLDPTDIILIEDSGSLAGKLSFNA
jgi:hypothetical protein